MPAAVRFELNNSGVAEVLHFPRLVADLLGRAGRVSAVAKGIAPKETGAYAASIGVHLAPSPKRARVRVQASIIYALDVEARHLTLTTALSAAGG